MTKAERLSAARRKKKADRTGNQSSKKLVLQNQPMSQLINQKRK